MSYLNRRFANRQIILRNRFVLSSHSATSLCLLFKRKSVLRLSICMLTKSNRFYFANKSFFEAQSWFTSLFNYCFLIEIVSSKMKFSTRDRFFHTFSTLAQFWIKSNNIRNDFEKVSFFESNENFAFFLTSISSLIVFLIISWKQSQFWVLFIK